VLARENDAAIAVPELGDLTDVLLGHAVPVLLEFVSSGVPC
jgi:hypothetical protein